MLVRTAGDYVEAELYEFVGQGSGVVHYLLGVLFELGLSGLVEGYADAGDRVIHGSALEAWEDIKVESLCVFLADKDHGADGTSKGLTGSHGDHVGVGEGRLVDSGRDQPCLVGDVCHVIGADFSCDGAHSLMINFSRIGGTAGDEDLGLNLFGNCFDLVVIKNTSLRVGRIKVRVVNAGGKGDGFSLGQFPAVGEVAAVVEGHAEHFVAWFEESGVHGEVSVAAGWALEVDVPLTGGQSEQLEGSLFYQIFDLVDKLVTLVVAFERSTLAVFVHED